MRGKVALVTAGWQEREGDDDPLVGALAVPVDNLRLHTRSLDVFATDLVLSLSIFLGNGRFAQFVAQKLSSL